MNVHYLSIILSFNAVLALKVVDWGHGFAGSEESW
jgi:hypothetical protein